MDSADSYIRGGHRDFFRMGSAKFRWGRRNSNGVGEKGFASTLCQHGTMARNPISAAVSEIFFEWVGEYPMGWRNSDGVGEKGFASTPCQHGTMARNSISGWSLRFFSNGSAKFQWGRRKRIRLYPLPAWDDGAEPYIRGVSEIFFEWVGEYPMGWRNSNGVGEKGFASTLCQHATMARNPISGWSLRFFSNGSAKFQWGRRKRIRLCPLPWDDSADSYIRGGLLGSMLNRDIRWVGEILMGSAKKDSPLPFASIRR